MPSTLNADVAATAEFATLCDRHFRNGFRRLMLALRDGGRVDAATITAKLPPEEATDVAALVAWMNAQGATETGVAQ